MNRGHGTPPPSSSDGEFEPVKVRHCIVTGLGRGGFERLPGLLVARRRTKRGWEAFVIVVEPGGDVRQTWVPASSIEGVGGQS